MTLSRSLAALDQDITLIAVIEMSQKSWLVGAIVPGIERHPLKNLMPDEDELLLLHRWRTRRPGVAARLRASRLLTRPGGTASGWRWVPVRGIGAYVIHASSLAILRQHRQAKTDRLSACPRRRPGSSC